MITRSLLVLTLAGCVPTAPDPACEAMLDCVAEADPLSIGSATSWFGPDGGCWSDPGTAARCALACDEARASLAARDPEATSCHPDPAAPLEVRVGRGAWVWTIRASSDCEGADRLRGAYDGRLTVDGDHVEIALDAPGSPQWRCHVADSAFTCAPTPAPDALHLEGAFHPSYVQLEGHLSDDHCAWTLSGWRQVAREGGW